jgi:hypothetical protein
MQTELSPLKDFPFTQGMDADQLELLAEIATPVQ